MAVPLTAAYENRFAISPDGTRVVHAPIDVSVWDGDRGRPFEVRDANTSGKIADIHLPIRPARGYSVNSIQFCDRGKYLLLNATLDYDPVQSPKSENPQGPKAAVDYLRVVDTKSYTLRTDISLSAAGDAVPNGVLAQSRRGYEDGAVRSYVVCAANAPFAAVVTGHSFGPIGIRIFNLETGAEVTQFNDVLSRSDELGVAISPDATNLAVFGPQQLQDMKDTKGVNYQITIVDLRTKKVARDIYVKSPFNFNSMKYAGESTIAIELFDRGPSESPPVSWTGLRNYFYTRASIHFFDVGSGAELRTISQPDNGDFRLLGISADGQTILVRTDTTHFCFSCNGGGGQEIISDSRFTLLKLQAGHPITRSPSLKVVHHGCLLPRWLTSGGFLGSCIAFDEEPELELSQGGNAVAALWKQGNQPILVYNLPSQ